MAQRLRIIPPSLIDVPGRCSRPKVALSPARPCRRRRLHGGIMSVRRFAAALLAASLVSHVLVSISAAEPGRCPNDSKLLNGGPTLVNGAGPGTWWGLV